MVMKTASAKSSGKAMASRVDGLCDRSAKDFKASRLGGRSDTHQHRLFDQFGLKTEESVTSYGGLQEGLTSLASKPELSHAMRRWVGGFLGLDLKTGRGESGAPGGIGSEDVWHHCEVCVEAKRSREDGVSVRGSSKKMDNFVLT